MLEATRILTAPLELNDVIRLTFHKLEEMIPFDQAQIVLRDEGMARFYSHVAAADPGSLGPLAPIGGDIGGDIAAHHAAVLDGNQTVIIPHLRPDHPLADAIHRSGAHQRADLAASVGSWMGVPLTVNDRTIGILSLGSFKPHVYSDSHATLATAFSNQAAAAIDNAHLRKKETNAVAVAERSRLARELHDSVSQALFGISLGAQAANQTVETNPQMAKDSINYVVNLVDGAISEMRALIFELRPESLTSEGLIGALRRQTEFLCKRHTIDASVSCPAGEPEIPMELKEGLYRIALEAVQNTIKHAHASQVSITLTQSSHELVLCVADDGRGFDTTREFNGHLGLISMRERAEQIGATFQAESAHGRGAAVSVSLPIA